jgi:hypothetical protein
MGFVECPDENHGLGVLLMPEDTGSFEAQVDDATDGAFHGAGADGQAQTASPGIAKAAPVAEEVVSFGFQRGSAGVAGDDPIHIGKYGLDLSGAQEFAGLVAPTGASATIVVRAGLSESAEVFDGVVEVDELNRAGRAEDALGNEFLEACPDGASAIGDEQDVSGLQSGEQGQVQAQQIEEGVDATESAVDQGVEGTVEPTVLVKRIDM